MEFSELPVDQAVGGLLAHTIKIPGRTLKKGHQLLEEDVQALIDAGVSNVVAAMLATTDVHEDAAALRLAELLAARQSSVTLSAPFTGRCNLIAAAPGVVTVDRDVINEINAIDESVTVATLAPGTVVNARQMIATIKVIPFAVTDSVLSACCAAAAQPHAINHHPFMAKSSALIQTRLPQTSDRLLDKTESVTQDRLRPLQIDLTDCSRCQHAVDALVVQLKSVAHTDVDLVLIAGASAIVDRRDVIPAAIEKAGGKVHHFGMPVDPGNLILLGEYLDKPVLGLPGCARSPKYNGLDMILERYAANLDVSASVLQSMGVGGLLKEIPSRPQPRAGAVQSRSLSDGHVGASAAIVLAAGQSRRMGADNKLLCLIDAKPMLVRTLQSVLASSVETCILVTGHDSDNVIAAIGDLLNDEAIARRLTVIHNPDFADGLSTSLQAGLTGISERFASVLVCLGDMPAVSATDINRLLAAFSVADDRLICVPTWRAKRGNPVLWARQFVDAMADLRGDVGARHLIGDNEHVVCEVAMSDDAVLTDIDTPAALSQFRQTT